MFSSFMINTWIAGTIVAVVAGMIGFFVVLRGSAFVAHAVPQGAFAGAAGAALVGVSTIVGLGVFSVLGALGIGWLGRRGRHDVVTALALVLMLSLGTFFLSLSVEYAPEVYSLLFGEVLGVARAELLPIAGLAAVCVAAISILYRPLLFASALPEVAEARGVNANAMETWFLILVAMATTLTVPVVGAFLMFSLMIGPAGAARAVTDSPLVAMGLSVAIALSTIWLAIAASYATNWPIGFFVGMLGAVFYGGGRTWAAAQRRRVTRDEDRGFALG